MLAKAKEKIFSASVQFVNADITREWKFRNEIYDLVSLSLVLEHTESLDHIFKEASLSLKPGGYVYVGELHPSKQYAGTKARFVTEKGLQVLECYTHHVSDFILSAKKHGLMLSELSEYFDDNGRNGIPRILKLIFKKD